MQLELIIAPKYYSRPTPGWVALVNGQPHHFTGKKAKKEAQNYLKEHQNDQP